MIGECCLSILCGGYAVEVCPQCLCCTEHCTCNESQPAREFVWPINPPPERERGRNE